MESADNQPGFFARLKQHHIYRVAAWYGASIAVLIQIVARAFPYFGWAAAVPAVIIILIAGFPVAIVLAWLLVKPTDPSAQTKWQQRHWILGAIVTPLVIVAVVVSGIFAFRFSERHEARVATEQATASIFNPPTDSIVVLPFANLSNDPNQQYFSDGITEELTGTLGQNTGLTVIAWDTASKFRDTKQTAGEMGRTLNVAHILDGSIQREGNQVRVSAELVSTITGQQLWSAHYDDTLKNIFAVQDKVSAAIAGALKVKFAGMQTAPTLNPQAHELYLKGRAAMDRLTAADLQAAQQDFQQAIALDPNYADAWAELAHIYHQLSEHSTLPLKESLPKIRAAAEKALALDPHNVNALVALGDADMNDNHIAQAKAEFEQALKLDPSNSVAHLAYGLVLPLKPGLAQEQEAALLDPDNVTAQNNLAEDYQDLGDWPQMLAASQALIKRSPHDIDTAFGLALAYTEMRRGEEAVKAFDLVQPTTWLDQQLVDAGRLTYQALLKPDLRSRALAALKQLRSAHISPDAQYYLVPLYLALGDKQTAMQILPGLCVAGTDYCNDIAVDPVYAQLHGDPRFEKLAKQYNTMTLGTAPASASSH